MRPAARHAFTLVELLVVIGIIALLISILLPSLNAARQTASQVKCMSNLRSIGQALVLYNNSNRNYNVPSYNMSRGPDGRGTISTDAANPMDGWAPILDRDGYLKAGDKQDNTVFMCPDTVRDFNANRLPTGSVLWPCINPNQALAGTLNSECTIPNPACPNRRENFTKIIRVGYWINAENPVGRPSDQVPGGPLWFYTASPGYGPMKNGQVMGLQKITNCRLPSSMIVMADGIYAGQQGATKVTDFNNTLSGNNMRIGYRHKKGGRPSTNVVYADGHAGPLTTDEFPYGYDIQKKATRPKSYFRAQYRGGDPTLHADPVGLFSQPDD